MRDQLANLVARIRGASRQERLYLVLGLVLVLVLVRYGVSWLVEYRHGVKGDIQLTADRLANARRTVARAPETQKHLAALRQRYEETVARLLPGDTPTLAAAALQERVSSLAAEKQVSLQTTQVMRDEAVGPFRKVTLRITATGELRQLADFLAQLEHGDLRVNVPFIELNRRGAARRDNAAGRAVSATIELNGIVQGSALAAKSGKGPVVPAAAGEGEGGPSAGVTLGPSAPAAPLALPGEPSSDENLQIPADALGTSGGVIAP